MSDRYENPCTPERCDVSASCSKGIDAMPQTWEYWRTCTTYALYLGHQEGYAAGQKDLARECWDWWSGERDCFNDDQFIRFEKLLREKGVM